MEQKFHYATVTDAINQLRAKGFNLDFNLEKNRVKVDQHEFTADEIEIVDVYRYEGASDPGDEATVYALASNSGLKGILVTGYGASSDESTDEILNQLHYKYQNKQ
jgi:hypothetical protein